MRLLVVPVAGALIVAAAACSPPPTAAPAETVIADRLPPCPVDALGKARGTVELTFWHSELAKTGETVDELVAAYNASQGQVHVTAEYQGSQDEVRAKYTSAAGAHQLPDLVELEETELQSAVDSGTVLPAESCMRAAGFDLDRIDPAVRAYYSLDGVFWPGFVSVWAPVLYFNRAHFEKAGLDPDHPPRTLDELIDAARRLKQAGVSKAPFALVLYRWWIVTWLTGISADVVNDDNGRDGHPTAPTFDTPTTRKLLRTLHDMKDEGLLQPYSPDSIDNLLALATDQSSMTLESSVAASSVQEFLHGAPGSGHDRSGGTGQIGAGPFPGMDEGATIQVGGPGWYIVRGKDPAKEAAAWDFLQFMLRPENVTAWQVDGSGLPFVKGALDDPAIREFWETEIGGGIMEEAYDQAQDIDPDNPGPAMGPYFLFSQALDVALQDVMLDDKDVDSAVKAAQAEMEEAFTEYYG